MISNGKDFGMSLGMKNYRDRRNFLIPFEDILFFRRAKKSWNVFQVRMIIEG